MSFGVWFTLWTQPCIPSLLLCCFPSTTWREHQKSVQEEKMLWPLSLKGRYVGIWGCFLIVSTYSIAKWKYNCLIWASVKREGTILAKYLLPRMFTDCLGTRAPGEMSNLKGDWLCLCHLDYTIWECGSQRVVTGPAALASLGNSLNMQILGTSPHIPRWEWWGRGM